MIKRIKGESVNGSTAEKYLFLNFLIPDVIYHSLEN